MNTEEKKELKVFELKYGGEKDWVCAYTNIEALITYFETTGTTFQDLDRDDDIVEVSKEKWTDLFVINTEYDESDPEDWEKKSFLEYMKEQKSPDIIATTTY